MNASILIIDDSGVAREMLRDVLERSGLFTDLFEAANGREALEFVEKETVDIVLCDLKMPGMDGFQFLDELKKRQKLQETPVIMLTGAEDRDQKIAGLERGASDYVTKPFDPGELMARVKVQLKIKSLQDRLRESNRMLEQLSLTDPLTGLANRRFFVDALGKAFERCRKEGGPIALAVLDLDYFKLVNDTYGHQAGDEVLIEIGLLLRQNLRPFDIVARYGGEEFAILLPDTDLETALSVTERLRYRVSKISFTGDLTDLTPSASIGIAVLPASGVDTVEKFMRLADEALYLAKRNGRNRVEFSDPGQPPERD